MTISEWLKARTAEWNALADAVDRLKAAPQIDVQITTSDQAEAEAVKRGQRPELVAALRRAL